MPILDLEPRVRREQNSGEEPLVFASANLSRVYFPGRGILYSLLVHELVFFALIFTPRPRHLTDWARPVERSARIDPSEPRKILYLPILGGGSAGLGLPERSPRPGRKGLSTALSPTTKGMTYPGRQPIISNPPNPDNRIQTLLQPTLKKTQPLQLPVFLPNLVLIANSAPPPRLVQPDPVMRAPVVATPAAPPPLVPSVVQPARKSAELMLPAVKPAQPLPKEMPKLVLPESVTENVPVAESRPVEPPAVTAPEQRAPETPEPSARLLDQPRTETSSLELSSLSTRGTDTRTLLALTPTPAPHDRPFEIPPGEARGRFAISPEPNAGTNETEPGMKTGSDFPVPGVGNPKASAEGNAVSTATTGTGTGTGTPKDKDSAGGGTGVGTGRGSRGGSVPGPGVGSGSGTGTGSGVGTGSGSGTGAGSGPGRGVFAGITIVGGATETGIAVNSSSPPRARRPLQTSYGVTIVSTEASGGGLPSYGVFGGAQVYTVYLDMRRTETDSAPSWTLEYALIQGAGTQTSAFEGPNATQQGLVLPFPTVRERPVFPVEVVRKYLRKMMIVFAIINTDGKMEKMSVMDSPDPLLNEPLLTTLSKWVFRPAQLNRGPVAAKVLMGIPLWLSE